MYIRRGEGAEPQAHPPGKVRRPAKGLPIDEIGPAADGLSQQKAQDSHVAQSAKGQLLMPGVEEHHQHRGDDRAVYGDAAVPHSDDAAPIQSAAPIAVQVQVEDHVVQPGAHDAAGHRPEHQIQNIVLRQPIALGLLHGEGQPRQQSHGQDDPIPVDPVADVDGDGIGVPLPIAEKPGKADGHVCHCVQSRFFLSYCGEACPAG